MSGIRDPYLEMPYEEQIEFIARRLGYDPGSPATWPFPLILELRRYRLKNTGPAFREHVEQFKLPVEQRWKRPVTS